MNRPRYQRGSRSLADNLQLSKDALLQKATAGPSVSTSEEDDEEYDIPDEIEEVIGEICNNENCNNDHKRHLINVCWSEKIFCSLLVVKCINWPHTLPDMI